MVIVDHLAAGIILPSLVESLQNTPALAVSVISSVLPDITTAFGWKGKLSYLSHRSGHTLLSALVLSVIPVLLVYLVMGPQVKNTGLELYILALLSYAFHIAMDTFTPTGTQALYPFSTQILSFDLLASLEPFTNTISVAFILFCLVTRKIPGLLFCHVFIAVYVSYVVFILIVKLLKSRKFRQYLKNSYPGAVYIKNVPRLFLKWKAIGKVPGSYIVMSDVRGEDRCKLYPSDLEIPDEIKESKLYKKFMGYARIPAALEGQGRFSLINLVFTPHTLRLDFVMDEEGRIIRHEITGLKIPDRGI
jgi:membrane-bound metal-dependent hydrolase YbcI (DUF457 family)